MKAIIWIFLFLPVTLFAQEVDEKIMEKRLRKISRQSSTVPEEFSRSTYHLAGYLASGAESDIEKVRSFYVWIANNITYDMVGFKAEKLPDYRPKAVLHNRYAVCDGFARLFNELCIEAGIRSEVIHGYSKGYGYVEGQKFNVTNHAWNAVFLEGEWKLIDVTWSAMRTNDDTPERPLNDSYFLAAPEQFISDHLPEIPAWQLLSHPISKAEFESSNIKIAAGQYNYLDSLELLLESPAENRTITYQLMARDFDPENDAANYELGLEYRFRGLDRLEDIYDVGQSDTTIFNELQKNAFESFDEAALYFTLIKPGSQYYKNAQVFLDDTDFERGVFKYEVAHRVMELFNKQDIETKQRLQEATEKLILKQYAEAADYFELIPRHSWYYDKAQEYLNEFLKNPFEPITQAR